MNDDEFINYIKVLQEAVIDLQKASKDHARNLLALWDMATKSVGLIREQTTRYQELQAQLNLVLLFVTERLSSTEQFAEFIADVVDANEACRDRPDMGTTHAAARALLEGGLKNYIPAARSSRPEPKPLPDNVVLFRARPVARLSDPLPPSETPESLDPEPQD